MDLVALAAIAGGTDAVAMAKAARAADWRALGWKAEKLVLHAAQNPKVAADASALAATQQAAKVGRALFARTRRQHRVRLRL